MKNWPQAFVHRMKERFGSEADSFLESFEQPVPVSVRMHPVKGNKAFDDATPIPWSRNGFYLSQRPSFTLDPDFHAGAYYVQEASSQFLEQLFLVAVNEIESPLVLDLCAAPGGKSTHLLSLLNGNGLLVSNEIIPARNKILRQNISKWGYANAFVTQNDPADFERVRQYFDIIVVDAPCSGEGLFRRDEDAAGEWSESAVSNCAVRQTKILDSAIRALKPGGYLIYSTCTFEKSENEDQIQYLTSNGFEIVFPVEESSGIVKSNYGYHFFPHKVKGEGFFISLLRKSDEENSTPHRKKEKPASVSSQVKEQMTVCLQSPEAFTPFLKDNFLYAIPQNLFNEFLFLSGKLFIRQAGIFCGEFAGKNFVPSAELALSLNCSKNFPAIEPGLETALAFLRGDSFPLTDTPPGFTIVKYHNLNLGWIKVLDRRINNYWPKEWRVLKR